MICKDTGRLVITHNLLADFNKSRDDKAFISGEFLSEFKAVVVNKLEWTNPIPFIDYRWIGQSRTIKRTGFDAELEAMITEEITTEVKDPVFFVSGEAYYPKTRREYNEKAEKEIKSEQSTYVLNETQQKIFNYLETVPFDAFTRKLNNNQAEIQSAIDEITDPISEHKATEKKLIQYRIINSIRENPSVHYRPSVRERTSRLFHSSDCVVALKKTVRKAFCKGWTDIDLKSSQFAILAEILDASLAKAFLDSNQDLWLYLNKTIFNKHEKPSAVEKTAFKAVIYGLSFGRSKKEITKSLKELGLDAKLFYSNPMIAELFSKREEWLDSIEHYGYVTDAWGNKIEVSKDRWAGAVAAAKIQSIEMEIISAVFDVASLPEYANKCKIMIFQHDGCTISFTNKETKPVILRRMQEALDEKAKKFNVIARLENEDL
jgi:hypothetical protein